MSSEGNPESNADQRQPEPNAQTSVAPKDQPALSQPQESRGQEERQITINLPPSKTKPIEVFQLTANIALAIIGAVAICIYGGQLKVMQRQFNLTEREMKGNDAAIVRLIAGGIGL